MGPFRWKRKGALFLCLCLGPQPESYFVLSVWSKSGVPIIRRYNQLPVSNHGANNRAAPEPWTLFSMSVHDPVSKITYGEYCLFPDDGNRHEVINGLHYMNPVPNPNHQTISKRLLHYLYTFVELPGLGVLSTFNSVTTTSFSLIWSWACLMERPKSPNPGSSDLWPGHWNPLTQHRQEWFHHQASTLRTIRRSWVLYRRSRYRSYRNLAIEWWKICGKRNNDRRGSQLAILPEILLPVVKIFEK